MKSKKIKEKEINKDFITKGLYEIHKNMIKDRNKKIEKLIKENIKLENNIDKAKKELLNIKKTLKLELKKSKKK